MKTSKIASVIVIGIMSILTLTLNVWGHEWYKLLVSTIVGIVVGVSIYDFKYFSRAFRVSRIYFIKANKNRTKIIKFLFTKTENKSKPSIIHAVLSFWIYFAILFTIEPVKWETIGPDCKLYCFMFFLLFVSGLLNGAVWFRQEPSNFAQRTMKKIIDKVGMKLGYKMTIERNFIYVAMILWPITLPVTVALCATGIMILFYIAIFRLIQCSIFILMYLLQLIVSIPLFIGFIFKSINNNNDALIIAWSIAAGGLIGTITLSYLIGISAGLIVMVCSLISNKYEIEPDIFLKGKYNFANKVAEWLYSKA